MKHLAPLLLSLGFVGACSAQAESDAPAPQATTQTQAHAKHKHTGHEVRTVKAGPDIRITSELSAPVSPGNTGTLNVTFTEGYPKGTMKVKASTSDGLSLITTGNATSFNMASGEAHEWAVHFAAPEAGRHYVNFHVEVQTAFGKLTRKSAAVVQVGKEGAGATASKSLSAVETNADGEPVIMMQAEETIIIEE